ncbi:spore germination protein [Paenibacillus thiaminolyticus]|uniref:Spore germination protein n=1 Tax=Paenibacillus thiaminolyticus TaxID=49283 RepID=A0AAP9DQQ5_PANTH|nr:spore germination protein [Paenibacillus thiaminolyticus]MCY9632703.1 spore germination protein [Paenibacillus thiaminolyticus]QDM42386.1 spore germination protein [Paenibacillus thiaminolyticus]
MGLLHKIFNNNQRKSKPRSKKSVLAPQPVFPNVQENIHYLREALFHTDDLVRQKVSVPGHTSEFLFLHTMCDQNKIREEIIKPISQNKDEDLEDIILAMRANKHDDLEKVIDLLVKGNAVLFIEGKRECFVIEVKAEHNRNVTEPNNEKIVEGSHEGFVENISINLQLVRKHIENRNLVVRRYRLGNDTKIEAVIVYLQNLANPGLVEEVDRRIQNIDADNITASEFIEEYIEDAPFSPFPQLLHTERPDRVIGNLLEGRVALMAEGSPTALILPATFFSFYQSPDDYSFRSLQGSFIRLIRVFSFVIAIALPAYYIAVVSFHYEVIPQDLLLPIKSSVEHIPYPPILEALFMELTIELLREAGIRLPGPVGQTIGIVGGLVIGDAVVKAGLVSNAMIIVVALTAIASFVVPSHEMSASVRMLRFPVMIAASLFGFMGIVFSLLIILIHLCKLESFGTPYFAPVAPFRWKDWKDTIIRLPQWMLNQRSNDPAPQKLVQERPSREEKQTDE